MILDEFHCEFFKIYLFMFLCLCFYFFLFAMVTSPNSMNKNFYYFEVIFYSSIGTGRVNFHIECQRPYHVERTWSRKLPEVKLRRVPLVLGRVTAWEYGMSLAMNSFISITNFLKYFFNLDGYQSKFVDKKFQ